MDERSIEDCWSQQIETPYFTFVWAEDENGLIGREGELPWHLPNEMKHFVEVTTGDVVVMGRKTYESIPKRPLKNRLNIVLTRDENYEAAGAIICHSKEEILEAVKEVNKPVHIIGGVSLFEMFIDEVNLLYRTIIYESFSGDTYMPKIDYKYFRVFESKEGQVDEKNPHRHQFFVYERKQLADPF
jgi:dihydrofolate reductase